MARAQGPGSALSEGVSGVDDGGRERSAPKPGGGSPEKLGGLAARDWARARAACVGASAPGRTASSDRGPAARSSSSAGPSSERMEGVVVPATVGLSNATGMTARAPANRSRSPTAHSPHPPNRQRRHRERPPRPFQPKAIGRHPADARVCLMGLLDRAPCECKIAGPRTPQRGSSGISAGSGPARLGV